MFISRMAVKERRNESSSRGLHDTVAFEQSHNTEMLVTDGRPVNKSQSLVPHNSMAVVAVLRLDMVESGAHAGWAWLDFG